MISKRRDIKSYKKKKEIGMGMVALVLLGWMSVACSMDTGYRKCEGIIWNTLYHITYKGSASLQDSILPVLNEVGRSLSVFDPQSLVAKLNESQSVEADHHLLTVYDESLAINGLSNGMFDPTLGPLIDAWGFGLGHTPNADTLAVDSVRTFVGMQKTHREGNLILKDDIRTRFNFSAIAKGYGCDAVGEMFKRNGVEDYMVEIGGELALSGKSPSDTDWKIAVDAPVEGKAPGEETALILSLTNVGVATSGNYRNYRDEDGSKRAHTISPVTGRPFISEILSATVIASSCMDADAIATACMASDIQQAKQLFEITHTEGLLIFADSLWMSPGFANFISN